MKIETNRLQLRLITIQDLDAIHALHGLPSTDAFNTLGIPKNKAETRRIMESWMADHQHQEIRNYTFAIEQQSDGQFVGLIALKQGSVKYRRAEVWFKIHEDHWGKGYATESLVGVLNFGFTDLKLHRIEAGCAVANLASIRVLEKVGMIREGMGRKVLPLKSGWSDNYEYAILETDERRWNGFG